MSISKEAQLFKINLALQNAPKYVADKTIRFGYDEIGLQEGIDLYNETRTKFDLADLKHAEQEELTIEHNRDKDNTRQFFVDLSGYARTAIGTSTEGASQLGLNVACQQNFVDWSEQARLFYTRGINDPILLELLNNAGISLEDLQEGQTMLNNLMVKSREYQGKKGEAQQSTRDKNEAFERLKKWFAKFKSACRICLRSRPDILEALGFVQYSPGYKKKKKVVSTTDPNPEPDPEPTPEPDPEPDPEPTPDPEPEPEPDPEPDPEQTSETD